VPRKTTLSHRLEYAGVRLFHWIVNALPAAAARELGALLGRAAFGLGVRRAVTLEHLQRVFGGEKTEEELVRIARASYENFGRTTFEFARFPRLSGELIDRTISVTGGEHLDRALEEGRGAILVAGHFGNWELAATLATRGYPLTFLVGEQHNILVDRLMNSLRARFGVEIVPLTGSLLGVLRALRRNRIVAMLSDQDAGRDGVFVDFLGKAASTPYGPGRLAVRTGAPILPGNAIRRGRGLHEIVILPPVARPLENMPVEEQVRFTTQAYTTAFESFIREHPDQYFWMHRRWKTRPPHERDSG